MGGGGGGGGRYTVGYGLGGLGAWQIDTLRLILRHSEGTYSHRTFCKGRMPIMA